MPLSMCYENGNCVPTVVCDFCGKQIRRGADGNYQWLWSDQAARLYFTHKDCCDAFEERQGGDWGVLELACLPAFLVRNLEISWRDRNGWWITYRDFDLCFQFSATTAAEIKAPPTQLSGRHWPFASGPRISSCASKAARPWFIKLFLRGDSEARAPRPKQLG